MREFELDAPAGLPHDTRILSTTTEPLPTDGSTEGSVRPRLLVVSPSKATYFTMDRRLRPALELLLEGRSVRDALAALAALRAPDPKGALRTLLTQVSLRQFFASAEACEIPTETETLHLYVTTACNLRCRHCYMEAGEPTPEGELTTAEFVDVIRQFSIARPSGRVTFSGGEPLLREDLPRLVTEAKRRGLRAQVFSNGLRISTRIAEFLAEHTDLLQVSVDGATRAVHDAVRGRGTFDRTLAALKRISDAAQGRKGFTLSIAFTLTRSNAHDVREHLARLEEQLDLKCNYRFSIAGTSNLGRARGDPLIYSNRREMVRLLDRMLLSLAQQGLVKLPASGETNRYYTGCGIGATLTIGANGRAYPCSITAQASSIGSVREEPIETLLSRAKSVSEAMSVERLDPCRTCDLRYLCTGPCRIDKLRRDGPRAFVECTEEDRAEVVQLLTRRHAGFLFAAGLSETLEDGWPKIVSTMTNRREADDAERKRGGSAGAG